MCRTDSLRCATLALTLFAFIGAALGDEADQTLALAKDCYATGHWAEGQAKLTSFLEQWPAHEQVPTALFLLGECLIKQGKYGEGRDAFLKSLERDPDNQHACAAIFRVGEASFLNGAYDTAEKELQWFRSQFPDDPLNAYTLYYLAKIALSSGDASRAKSLCLHALREFPSGPTTDRCRFQLARAMDRLGDISGARSEYRRLIQDGGPLADNAAVQMGISAYNRGLYSVAERAFSTAAQDYPDSDLLPNMLHWQGMCQMGRGEWQTAVQTFEQALAQFPSHPLAPAMAYWAGESCRQMDQTDLAEEWYRRVGAAWPSSEWADDALLARIKLALEGDAPAQVTELAATFGRDFGTSELNKKAQQLFGRCLLDQQDYAGAIRVFSQLTKAEPADAESSPNTRPAPIVPVDVIQQRRENLYYLALSHLGVQQYQDALDALNRIRPRQEDMRLADAVNVARGLAYMGLEQYDQAISPLQSYLAAQPNGPDAQKCRIRLALAWAHTGQLDRAIQECDQLADEDCQNPSYLPTLYYLADQAYERGHWSAAERLFSRLTAVANPEAYRAKGRSGLGWTYYRQSNLERAAAEFERLMTDHPKSPLAAEAAMMRGKVMEQMGQLAPALESYLIVITSYHDSDHYPAALFAAVKLQESAGRKDDAASLLISVINQNPEFSQMDAALYHLGWLLMDLEDEEQAEKAFTEVALHHPDSPFWADSVYRLAEAAMQTEDYDHVFHWLDLLLGSENGHPRRAHALYLKGQAATRAERWEDVVEAMQELLAEYPEHELRVPAEFMLGESYYHQQQYDEALEQFFQMHRYLTDDAPTWMAIIPLREAQILAAQQRWQAAYVIASKIEERFEDFDRQYEVDYLIGQYHAADGKFDEAREAFGRVVDAPAAQGTEVLAMAWWMTGDCLRREHKYEQAIEAYGKVLSVDKWPEWQAAARLQTAKCHLARGEDGEAARWLQQVIDRHPETEFAKEASQRLDNLRIQSQAAAAN